MLTAIYDSFSSPYNHMQQNICCSRETINFSIIFISLFILFCIVIVLISREYYHVLMLFAFVILLLSYFVMHRIQSVQHRNGMSESDDNSENNHSLFHQIFMQHTDYFPMELSSEYFLNNTTEDNRTINLGMSQAEINDIATYAINTCNIEKYAKEKCMICLEYFKKANTIRKLKCPHFFHKECIDLVTCFKCICFGVSII